MYKVCGLVVLGGLVSGQVQYLNKESFQSHDQHVWLICVLTTLL